MQIGELFTCEVYFRVLLLFLGYRVFVDLLDSIGPVCLIGIAVLRYCGSYP